MPLSARRIYSAMFPFLIRLDWPDPQGDRE